MYEKADWYKGFDVIIHDECSADVKDLKLIQETILKPHKDGLPAVVLHCGMHCYRSEGWPKAVTPWFEFTGLPSTGHGAQKPIAITYVDKESPITRGLGDWTTINEELYNNSAGKLLDTAHALARGKQGKEDFVVAWTNIYNGKTKVFATTIGHNNETVADARYLDLVTRGLLWSVDKLDDQHLKPAVKGKAAAGATAPDRAAAAKKIAQGFETQGFKTRSGDEVEFRNATGASAVPRKREIDRRGKRDPSVMPEGLVGNLSPEEFASLLAYLESLKGK